MVKKKFKLNQCISKSKILKYLINSMYNILSKIVILLYIYDFL